MLSQPRLAVVDISVRDRGCVVQWLVCTVVVRLTGVRFPARPILLIFLDFFCFVLAPKHTAKTCDSVSKNISRLYSLAVEHSLSKREVTGSSPVGGYEILLFLVP